MLLYRIWPQIIDAMVLVKPATVVANTIQDPGGSDRMNSDSVPGAVRGC
jgi:hypothetical protein